MAVNWCLAFPYAPNEEVRAQAFEVVTKFYAHHFPDVPRLIHSATPVGERFLRATTRNDLVRQAEERGFDVVCLVDADTLIHPDGIRRMVHRASRQDFYLGKPFRNAVNTPLAQQRALAAATVRWPRGRFQDPGAAWVIRPESWWRSGGMDETFHGWGGDDTTFQHMFTALGGATEYDRLPAVKTEHSTARWSLDPAWADTWYREAVCKTINRHHPELAPEWLTVRHLPGVVTEWLDRLGIAEEAERALEGRIARDQRLANRK